MRRILLLCLTAVFVFASSELWAQERTVTGRISSSEDGSPLPGVNVVLKGTTNGTVTDVQGNYSIRVPSQGGFLVFTFIGLTSQEIEVGDRSVVDISMAQDVRQLTEVVVTANGIERDKRGLGYSVTSVKGEEITKAREVGFVNSLAGKIAGVRVSSQSGTLGGSSKIVIRGANSLGTASEPLFVVDGIPINNSSFSGDRTDIINGGVDGGNRASDISSDDIATFNVLKGAAATALYGSRAANGAIIITTKRGSKGQKATIEVNSSVRADNVLKLPDFQNDYAQGNFGQYSSIYTNGWGPKISDVQDQTFTDYKGSQVKLQAHPDNVKNFYKTGFTTLNSISFADANDKSDIRVGYTNTRQSGVIPNSELQRNNIAINTGMKLANKFTARTSITYVRTDKSGITGQGSNNSNIIPQILNSMPRTIDVNDLKQNTYDPITATAIGLDGTRRSVNNPYWVANNNGQTNIVERVFGNATIGYDPTSWLNLTGRVGTDVSNDYRRFISRKGTLGNLNGSFDTYEIDNRDFTSDIMANITKEISTDLKFKATLGYNIFQRTIRRQRVQSQNLNIDGLYTYTNAQVNTPTNTFSKKRLEGVYADLTFTYKDYLTVEITGRNDFSSTLPKSRNSYFYPSISGSFIFTEALNMNSDVLSTGKIRANYANVGSDTDPYQLQFSFNPLSTQFTQYLPGSKYPFGGLLAFGATDIIPNADLKPQNQASYEIGTELTFFNGRIGLDLTYYKNLTKNQIINIDIPQSTGYASKSINAGSISNTGVEVTLSGKILKQPSGFNWDMNVNFTAYKQKVEELAPGLSLYVLTSGFSGIQVEAAPGQQFGLYGGGWLRDPNGNIVINASTGLRQTATNQRLGNIYPDWTMGINNTFSYKGFVLNFLVDIRQGGVLYSATAQTLRVQGLAKETAANRDGVFIDKGVVKNADGTYSPNTTPVQSMQQFWTVYSGNANSESSTFDASYIKLREARLAFNLPSSLVNKTPFGAISVGVEGRNLWIIKSHVPHVDPEANFFGASLIGEGVEFNSIPSTRTMGVNLRFTF